jgi:hypothetical protein
MRIKIVPKETENNLRGYASALESLSSWDDLEQQPKLVQQIFYTCNLFDIDVRAAISDHRLKESALADEYYAHALQPTIWLNNSEIAAYLLTLGYSFEGSEQYSAGTVIEFKNEEGISIFFYNNAQNPSASTVGKGMHLEACVKNSSGIALEGGINSEHNNIDVGDINKYWGKYTLECMSEILMLRLDDLALEERVQILEGIFIGGNNNNILSLIERVVLDDSNKTILVPLNLFNKHAVGLVFEKCGGNVIKITYIDPSNEEMPQELKDLIYSSLRQIDFEIEVVIQELSVELQKYANCGPEVIENFLYYLTGSRVSQEEAIELHSELMERKWKYSESDVVSMLFDHLSDNEDFVLDFAGTSFDIFE